MILLKLADAIGAEADQIVEQVDEGARGRQQRIGRYPRRQRRNRDGGKHDAGIGGQRRRFRIGQQYAQKGQTAA